MHQLAIVQPIAVPMCQADAEIAAALSFAELEKSEGTRRAYRSDFRIFAAWCGERGLEQMPASPETVARFLSHQATSAKKSSTIGRRAAAIAYAHKLAGFEPPTSAETVRAVVRGIRRSIGTAPVRKAPATANWSGRCWPTARPPCAAAGTRRCSPLVLRVRSAARSWSR
jgi:hypothetical protein